MSENLETSRWTWGVALGVLLLGLFVLLLRSTSPDPAPLPNGLQPGDRKPFAERSQLPAVQRPGEVKRTPQSLAPLDRRQLSDHTQLLDRGQPRAGSPAQPQLERSQEK